MCSKEVLFPVLEFYGWQWAAGHNASWKVTKQENTENLNDIIYFNI